jgi:hypothetical protein
MRSGAGLESDGLPTAGPVENAEGAMMIGAYFLASLVAATFGGGLLWDAGALGAPAVADGRDGPLLRLLRFAPSDTQVVEYANLLGLKRAIGAQITTLDDVPVPPEAPDAPRTAQQEIGRAWWWDFWAQIPKPRVIGNERISPSEWDRIFGFNLFDVDFALQVGDPPVSSNVIEGSIDPALVGERLTARGFTRALSPLSEAAAFYIRGEDYDNRVLDEANRYTLASFNRVVAAPGVLIAGPATNVVSGSVRAATGQVSSLADDPELALLATTMDDPTLLPGTELLGATLLGRGAVERVATGAPDLISCPGEPIERLRERAERARPLTPYPVAGLGYRRGSDLNERYWLFTLLYPDEAAAREAGGVLVDRVKRYRSRQAGGPLLGTYVDEVLPPVVRSGAAGATVSLLLRAKPEREASWLLLYGLRDLGFLAVGQPVGLCPDADQPGRPPLGDFTELYGRPSLERGPGEATLKIRSTSIGAGAR